MNSSHYTGLLDNGYSLTSAFLALADDRNKFTSLPEHCQTLKPKQRNDVLENFTHIIHIILILLQPSFLHFSLRPLRVKYKNMHIQQMIEAKEAEPMYWWSFGSEDAAGLASVRKS